MATSQEASEPFAGARPGEAPVRILLVDDHELIRAALAALLSSQPSLEVVGACELTAAPGLAAAKRPDVVVLTAGDEVACERSVRRLAELGCRVLLIASEPQPAFVDAAMGDGVHGALTPHQPAAVLLKAIAKVHAGELWFDRARTAGLLRAAAKRPVNPDRDRIATLTRRELEVVRLVGEGLRNADVGGRLFISEATVRNHLTSILGKLGLADRFELAVYAFKHGLVRFS